MKSIPQFLKKYFWDIGFKELKLAENESFIAERILEHGDPKAISWLLKHIQKKSIKKTLLTRRVLSPKSANFWALYFGLPKDKILCLKKSYLKMRKSHWPY